jgi:hypothetical protein
MNENSDIDDEETDSTEELDPQLQEVNILCIYSVTFNSKLSC